MASGMFRIYQDQPFSNYECPGGLDRHLDSWLIAFGCVVRYNTLNRENDKVAIIPPSS